jgi:N-glycosylase/DNA lyase
MMTLLSACGVSAADTVRSVLNREVEITVGDGRRRFRWGRVDELGTAAFWVEQTIRDPAWSRSPRLGADLAHEVGACVLGGHGMPADICLAAFARLSAAGVFQRGVRIQAEQLRALLAEPLAVPGRAKPVRYRFWRQRADRLAACLEQVWALEGQSDARALRDSLLALPGVGPKTASWVVRNHMASDDVAIIDVHVYRAGVAAGFFNPEWRLPANYRLFEEAFVAVAELGQVRTSALDACIWGLLSWLGPDGRVIVERSVAGDAALQPAG